MLSDREKSFIDYWEAHRKRERTIGYQLLAGLPLGLLFSLPIIFLLFSARYWYKRADMEANSLLNPLLLVFAVFSIAVFMAVMYKRHQWEMKEQQYQEIKAREKKNV